MPLLVAAPGRRGKGKSSRALVELVDLYPTMAEACDVAAPPGYEGQSFVPLLDDPSRRWKTATFTQVSSNREGIVGRSVRTDRYRYIRWEGPHPDEELYDQQGDAREFNNLARDGSRKELLQTMRGVLDRGWKAAMAPG